MKIFLFLILNSKIRYKFHQITFVYITFCNPYIHNIILCIICINIIQMLVASCCRNRTIIDTWWKKPLLSIVHAYDKLTKHSCSSRHHFGLTRSLRLQLHSFLLAWYHTVKGHCTYQNIINKNWLHILPFKIILRILISRDASICFKNQ